MYKQVYASLVLIKRETLAAAALASWVARVCLSTNLQTRYFKYFNLETYKNNNTIDRDECTMFHGLTAIKKR